MGILCCIDEENNVIPEMQQKKDAKNE